MAVGVKEDFVIARIFIIPKELQLQYQVRCKGNKKNTHHQFYNLIVLKTINLTKTVQN
jgi:hypothetical protein